LAATACNGKKQTTLSYNITAVISLIPCLQYHHLRHCVVPRLYELHIHVTNYKYKAKMFHKPFLVLDSTKKKQKRNHVLKSNSITILHKNVLAAGDRERFFDGDCDVGASSSSPKIANLSNSFDTTTKKQHD
jgi:hypothetical protein